MVFHTVHCGKDSSRKFTMSKHMLVVHGASLPSKILQDRYLAKLMARKRISYILHHLQIVWWVCRSKLIVNVALNNHILLLLYEENISI